MEIAKRTSSAFAKYNTSVDVIMSIIIQKINPKELITQKISGKLMIPDENEEF